jgi:hypothetical protein
MKNFSELTVFVLIAAVGFAVCSCSGGVREGDNSVHAAPDPGADSWVSSMPEPPIGAVTHP